LLYEVKFFRTSSKVRSNCYTQNMFNAYILDWTMNDYEILKQKLADAGFLYEKDESGEDIRVTVPYEQLSSFASIVQKFLNATQNYIDIQYPDIKKTILIFRDKLFTITNDKENKEAQDWAISIGLPKEQSDWSTSY
jgi:hypothetical protein